MSLQGGRVEGVEIPAEVRDILGCFAGTDRCEVLEEIYFSARCCSGIALLIRPSLGEAVAAAMGTLASASGPARLYVIDTDLAQLTAYLHEMSKWHMSDHLTFYHGSPRHFFRELPLGPQFVCLGARAAESDGPDFRADLPPRTSVLVTGRSETGILPTVRSLLDQGVLEIAETDHSPGYRTTRRCEGTRFVPRADLRLALQVRLHQRYFLSGVDRQAAHTPVADLTQEIRREFSVQNPGASGYGQWPYFPTECPEIPETLPGGKQWPKISVVTPTFNRAHSIETTILSVLHQGYPNLEYIVVNDGSTDHTLEVLEHYRDQIVTISQPNRGQSAAINKGMAAAKGSILTWINDDDMLAPGAAAAMALAFETSGADMVAGICRIYRDGQLLTQHLTCCPDGPLPLQELLDLDNCWNVGQFFYQPETMFTRDIWMRAGGYVREDLYSQMDYELWLRFAKAGARVHAIGRPIAWFRVHEQQKTYKTENFYPEQSACRDAFAKQEGITPGGPAVIPGVRNKLRVLMLNDHGPFFGAGIAHTRLARALAWAGHEVNLLSILDSAGCPKESAEYSHESVADRVAAANPDLVIVGNLHGANADPMLLHYLCTRFPTLVVLHDFGFLTGRCAYTAGCEKYLTGCDAACPTPTEYPALPASEIAEAWLKKHAILTGPFPPILLANSQWTAKFAHESFVKSLRLGESAPPIEVCQLSFPLDIFRPRDKRACREALGLPQDRFLILFSGSLADPRKGGRPLLEALARLELPDLQVIIIGVSVPNIDSPVEVNQMGYISDQNKVAMLNAAADIVVAPSSAETFGQIFVEAPACGTPVVAYPVSAASEVIRDGVTGILAADTNPASLAAAIHYLYTHPEVRRNLASWGRMFVENEWSEFSGYRQLFLALQQLPLSYGLRLTRKISFLPETPVRPTLASIWRSPFPWRAWQGFSAEESAPQLGLDTFRWAYGPYAFAEITAEKHSTYKVVVAYRNPHDNQRLTLKCNGTPVGAFDLPNTGYESGRVLLVDLPLEAGGNLLEFRFSCWYPPGQDPRPLAVMISEILWEPMSEEILEVAEPEPRKMLAGVWGQSGR